MGQEDDGTSDIGFSGKGVKTAWRAGSLARLVPPENLNRSFGSKGRLAQFASWKCEAGVATAPSLPVICASTAKGSQLVGLRAKPGRSRSTRSSAPVGECPEDLRQGIGDRRHLCAERIHVDGGADGDAAKVVGPDTPGMTTRRLSGAPSYGPAR